MFHRRAHRWINATLLICGVCFLFIISKTPSDEGNLTAPSFIAFDPVALGLSDVYNDTQLTEEQASSDLSGWTFKNTAASHGQNVTMLGSDVVDAVNFLNEHYSISNTNRFGPVENVKSVIVIQVHNRVAYLRYLIESLRETKGIEDTLLVFSHDINVVAINEIISNITFARVYQIFYPYNLQLFPHVYPGQEPTDCPEKIGKELAETRNCSNWKTPDTYGNYRVAKLTQIKHHWWWKMNYVFDGIVQRYQLQNAWILLLEEDHFVVPDALHMLNSIIDKKQSICARCEIIALGVYLKTMSKYRADIAKLGVHPWFSSKHNMGMALQLSTWKRIKGCSEMFCKYDDYNWDWSLMQTTVKCLPERFKVIWLKSPRVLHIGDCGVHTHRCNAHNAYASAKKLVEQNREQLFPQNINVADVSRRSLKPSKPNGGWGDVRDHELCRLNANPLNAPPSTESVLSSLFGSSVRLNPLPPHNSDAQTTVVEF